MLDMRQDLQARGRDVPMRDMPLLAGPRWSQLSDGQKQAYNQRAKRERRMGQMSNLGCEPVSLPRLGKMDCTGELLSVGDKRGARGVYLRYKHRMHAASMLHCVPDASINCPAS